MPLLLAAFLTLLTAAACSAEVINAGVGGNRTTQLLKRLDRDVLAHQPTAVVLMVGTNDRLNSGGFVPAKDYGKNVETLVKRIQAGGAKVLLVAPPPCIPEWLYTRHDPAKFAGQDPHARMAEVRDILLKLATRLSLPVVDFHEHLRKHKLAGNDRASVIRNPINSGKQDGVHLTEAGYRLLAELISAKLRAEAWDTATLVCFGDSLTAAGYPAMLESMLEAQPKEK